MSRQCERCQGFVSADPLKAKRHETCELHHDPSPARLAKRATRMLLGMQERAEQREAVKDAVARHDLIR